MVTKEEFERQYAQEYEISVADLRALGGHAIPCTCEWDDCCGWMMSFEDDIQEEEEVDPKFAPMRRQTQFRE